MSSLMKVENLGISFHTYAGEVRAVRGISFGIEEAKTTAIVGESGCGKSVTAKALMGLIEFPGEIKEESKIVFEGKNILENTKKDWNDFRGKECSMIFQDALVALNPTQKIGKQIIESLKNHYSTMKNEEMKKSSADILKKVGITDAEYVMNKYPHELSGGMRQRVMIAIAVIANPKMLIADEPTTALDVTIQAQILRLLKKIQKESKLSIILITHDLGIVANMADSIIVMYAGKIVEEGSVRDIFYNPKHPYTVALLKAVPRIDSNNQEELSTIEGNIPNLITIHEGCSFYDRCPYAMKICKMKQPSCTKISESHEAFCWLMDARADRSDMAYDIGGNENE